VTGHWWVDVIIGIVVAALACWLILIVALLLGNRRQKATLADALRLLPDLIRLLRRVAGDRSFPVSVRARIWGLLVYLALPIDLVPDIIPVLGYADDAIITVIVLRSVVRRIGIEGLRRHWPGTEPGFQALLRLTGITEASPTREV
jgi:uncharacterized membrane protein YkvA (DUF1232 family)